MVQRFRDHLCASWYCVSERCQANNALDRYSPAWLFASSARQYPHAGRVVCFDRTKASSHGPQNCICQDRAAFSHCQRTLCSLKATGPRERCVLINSIKGKESWNTLALTADCWPRGGSEVGGHSITDMQGIPGIQITWQPCAMGKRELDPCDPGSIVGRRDLSCTTRVLEVRSTG